MEKADDGWVPVYVEQSRKDYETLARWLDEQSAATARVVATAMEVRRRAEALVLDPAPHDKRRIDLEQQLRILAARLQLEVDADRFEKVGTFHEELVTRYAQSFVERYATEQQDRVKELERWPEITSARGDLSALFTRDGDRRSAARFAADQAQATATQALWRSAREFKPRPFRLSRPSRAAAAPFVAFVLVASGGAVVSPTSASGVGAAVAVLSVSALLSIVDAWRKGTKTIGTDNLLLGAGASLAIFTALYLVCSWFDPGSVLRSGDLQPISAIGEAALLSLTLGGTVGTIGIELVGPARIIAFVQLLFTLTAVGTTLTWAWQRLLEHRENETLRRPQ